MASLATIDDLWERKRGLQERFGDARIDLAHAEACYRNGLTGRSGTQSSELIVLAGKMAMATRAAIDVERELDECVAAITRGANGGRTSELADPGLGTVAATEATAPPAPHGPRAPTPGTVAANPTQHDHGRAAPQVGPDAGAAASARARSAGSAGAAARVRPIRPPLLRPCAVSRVRVRGRRPEAASVRAGAGVRPVRSPRQAVRDWRTTGGTGAQARPCAAGGADQRGRLRWSV